MKKVVESDITIDCIYFDESHNGTARSFFDSVSAMSKYATRCYYFTATPRISYKHDRGMNNKHIWGNILESVPAPELIDGGSKIVLQNGDELKVQSDTDASLNCYVSFVDAISE